MVAYYGDFAEDDTVNIPFNTFDSNDPSNSVTATDLIASDIYVHKDGSATAITTDGATIDIDAPGVGAHMITIDTSVDAAYATGSEYSVRVDGVTVDGGTVNAWVGSFSIERAGGVLALLKGAGGLSDINTDVEAILLDTGTTIPGTITTAQNDLDTITGTAGALIGTDAANVTTLSDAVWDEVLTGANHNTATTAGRRLRELNDFGQYEGAAVWYDDVNGAAGTTAFENGTAANPSNAEASVTTLLASLGFTTVHMAPGSTYVLEATYANKVFTGENWTLDLNGQSCVGCTFIGATVSGAMAGTGTTQQFKNCIVGATSIIKGTHFIDCGLSGTQTLIEAGDIFYDHCHSGVAGSGSVTFDFGAALNSSDLNVRHHSGGWTIANMGAGTGTYNGSFEGNGQIVWAASCSATSNASIRGNWKITDSAGGAVTETLDDNQTSIDSILTDTNELQGDWTDGGRLDAIIDLILADTAELQADWANGGRLDLILDIIAADTTTDIPALIATAQADLDTITGADGVTINSTTQASIDAIETDTNSLNDGAIAELGVAAPSATPTLQNAMMLIYMALRNKRTTTATTDLIFNDAGTQIAASTISDDATTFTKGEYA